MDILRRFGVLTLISVSVLLVFTVWASIALLRAPAENIGLAIGVLVIWVFVIAYTGILRVIGWPPGPRGTRRP